MSVVLSTPREQEKVERAIREAGTGSSGSGLNLSDLALICDGEDLGPDILDGHWGQDSSSATSCDFTLGVILPERMQGAETLMRVTIEGVEVPLMVGADSYFEIPEGGGLTDPFWSKSAAGLWGETTLDREIEYPGAYPHVVVREALDLVPYSRGTVTVEPLEEPVLYLTKGNGDYLLPEHTVADVLSVVNDQTSYTMRDTAYGGHIASAAVRLGSSGGTERTYEARDMPSWRPPPRTSERYSRVVVFRRNPDGNLAFFEEAPVAYRGIRPPKTPRTLYVELDDLEVLASGRARQLVYDLAVSYGRSQHADKTVLPSFDPLVERLDAFSVHENHRDMDGTWDRLWLAQVDEFDHERTQRDESGPGISTSVTYTATLFAADLIKVPAFIGPDFGSSVLVTPVVGQPYGEDEISEWFDPGVIGGQSWFGVDDTGDWIDLDLAPAAFSEDVDGEYVEF